MFQSDCPCTEPGWCEQYQMQMTTHWVKLCQTRPEYRALWQQGIGPGQFGGTATPRAKGLGDKVADTLKKLGITPERYVEVKQRFGLPPTCDCAKRQEWLNQVGRWLAGE
jgi:hypothetical protein